MKSPVSPRGATDEPYGSQRRAGNPAYPAQMTAGQGIGGANHGSQCPLTPPGLSATARGESAGGGSPPDFLRPVQTPDSCLGVKGSRARLQSLPSFTQAFFAQAFFTFDFIPQTLPSLFGPVDRAGPAACVRDYAAGARRCRLLGRLCAARAGAGRVAAQPSAAAVTGSSIRSGSPCRARERRASSAPARRNAWRSSLLSGRPAGRLLPFVRAVTLPAPRPGC